MGITNNERRNQHYKERADRQFGRGFALGIVTTCVIVAAFIYGQREAYGAERPAPRHGIVAMSNQTRVIDTTGFPPNWRTWLRIGMCEQPKRGISWHDVDTDAERLRSIAWRQNYNSGFPGGLGFTRESWRMFRPHSARNIESMDRATIAQQLWAAERLWRWAEREYPTNGHSAWECSYVIGWTTSDPKDALR